MRTANEINEEFEVRNENADVLIDGLIQNTIVYTLGDVNKIIQSLSKTSPIATLNG